MSLTTPIPDLILDQSQLSISARYLYCVLVSICGEQKYSYIFQNELARILNRSTRYIRILLNELIKAGLVAKGAEKHIHANYFCISKPYLQQKSNKHELKGVAHKHPKMRMPLMFDDFMNRISPLDIYLLDYEDRAQKENAQMEDFYNDENLL